MSDLLTLRPRHKWFGHTCREAEDGWIGPHAHIEDAVREAALDGYDGDWLGCWVAQGRRLRKSEREEMGVEYHWEVDTRNAIRVELPKEGGVHQTTHPGGHRWPLSAT